MRCGLCAVQCEADILKMRSYRRDELLGFEELSLARLDEADERVDALLLHTPVPNIQLNDAVVSHHVDCSRGEGGRSEDGVGRVVCDIG